MLLFPKPRRVEEGEGYWACPSGLDSKNMDGGLEEFIDQRNDSSLSDEAYRLAIGPQGVGIEYSGQAGRRHALTTLKQILRQKDSVGRIPALNIEDKPLFPHRGVHLDISRTRIPTMETLFLLIDLFSELKLNQIQLYTEHSFAYKGHKRVWKDASPLTGKEVEVLDAYCRDRGLELVPNQNSIGHMERWLRHPEYHHIAEVPDGYLDPWNVRRPHGSTLDPSNPASLDFLKDLYDQLLPHFSSRSFNIGGDEPFDLGQGRSRERCEKEGGGRVYLEFLNKIVAEVEGRGYRTQYWADIILNHPELIPETPQGGLVMNWGYEAEHPFEKETQALADSDRTFYVCPGTSSWNSLAGRWDNARANIALAARTGLEQGAVGLLNTDWGDNGHKQQYIVSMPGWFAGAAAGWNGPEGADEDVRRAMQVHLFRDPEGREAQTLLDLGNIYKENPQRLHNMSFLLLPLVDQDYPYYRGEYKAIQRGGMGQSRELSRAAVDETGDGGTWRRQLNFTARITAFAAELADTFFSSRDFNLRNVPESIRSPLADELEGLMRDYAAMWLETSRRGGLEESLEGFRGVLKQLSERDQ